MKRNCKKIYVICMLLLLAIPAYSQSAADIEGLLSEKAITCEQAAWFTLVSVQEAAEEDDPLPASGAFAAAQEKGWIKAEGGDAITLSRLSLLLMHAYDLKGGLMYRLTGSARYAFREMKALGFINGRVYPNQTVSGEEFLQILGSVTAEKDGAW